MVGYHDLGTEPKCYEHLNLFFMFRFYTVFFNAALASAVVFSGALPVVRWVGLLASVINRGFR